MSRPLQYETILKLRLPRSMKRRLRERADAANMGMSEFTRMVFLLSESLKVFPKEIKK